MRLDRISPSSSEEEICKFNDILNLVFQYYHPILFFFTYKISIFALSLSKNKPLFNPSMKVIFLIILKSDYSIISKRNYLNWAIFTSQKRLIFITVYHLNPIYKHNELFLTGKQLSFNKKESQSIPRFTNEQEVRIIITHMLPSPALCTSLKQVVETLNFSSSEKYLWNYFPIT